MEEEEEEEEEYMTQEQLSNTEVSQASSDAVLLSEPQEVSVGVVNPAFSPEKISPDCCSRPSSQCTRPLKLPRWACVFRDRPCPHSRSLSSSVENMTLSGTPLSPVRGSITSINDPVKKVILSGRRIFRDDASLRCSRSRGIVVVFNAWIRKCNCIQAG